MPGARKRFPASADDALATLYGAPGHLIRRCQQIAVAIFMDETKSFGLTPVQYAALVAVRARPAIDQTRLVKLIALDRSTIGSVVGRLEARGLIARRAGSVDRRTKLLHATRRGATLLDRIGDAVARAQIRILAPLAPAERVRFITMLARLVDINNTLSRAPLLPTSRARGARAKPIELCLPRSRRAKLAPGKS